MIRISASDLVAEANLLFGWNPEYIFEMPATRFFKLMESGRRLSEQEKAREHVAQCDIQTISLANSEYYEKIRKRFYYRAIGREEMLNPERALDPTEPATIMAIKGLFETASKLHG